MPYRCSHGGLLDLCLDVSCSMFHFLFIQSLSHKPPVSCYSAKLGFPAINIYLIQIPCVFPKYLNWCSLLHACLKFNTDDCQRMTNPSMWVCVECCLRCSLVEKIYGKKDASVKISGTMTTLKNIEWLILTVFGSILWSNFVHTGSNLTENKVDRRSYCIVRGQKEKTSLRKT